VAWGDYDGDNDLDILIAGAYSCRIYNNTAGVFTDIAAGLPAVSNCWADWGDFDNDGDLDVFVMGDLGGILISAVYRNDAGVFAEMPQAGIIPLAGGSASWCDFDHDRDLDLLITGFNEYLEPQTTIFSNLGNMEFMDVEPALIGASLATAAWGDYDNDGEADILLTGQNVGCGILSSMVYHNEGSTLFTDINADLDGAERGSAAWGDYDNDGDLDILISGITGSGTPATRLYANNAGSNMFSSNFAHR
ncbi:VCBS repeat-containing protein, partial [bacterium]|nr:VCBS repeat-containing protein [bacterium]